MHLLYSTDEGLTAGASTNLGYGPSSHIDMPASFFSEPAYLIWAKNHRRQAGDMLPSEAAQTKRTAYFVCGAHPMNPSMMPAGAACMTHLSGFYF